jgi:hypothetical protein
MGRPSADDPCTPRAKRPPRQPRTLSVAVVGCVMGIWALTLRVDRGMDGFRGPSGAQLPTLWCVRWMPRRVEWRHARTNELIGTLATYTVQMGRKLLMPQQHTMSRRAIKLWSKLRDRYSPSLPQSLDHVWRHNTWCPRTLEYAWRVLSGLQYTPSMQWMGAVES